MGKQIEVNYNSIPSVERESFHYTDWKVVTDEFFQQLAEELPHGFVLYTLYDHGQDGHFWKIGIA